MQVSITPMQPDSCHDANFLPLLALEIVITTTSAAVRDEKVGFMKSLGFQCAMTTIGATRIDKASNTTIFRVQT